MLCFLFTYIHTHIYIYTHTHAYTYTHSTLYILYVVDQRHGVQPTTNIVARYLAFCTSRGGMLELSHEMELKAASWNGALNGAQPFWKAQTGAQLVSGGCWK